MFKMCKIDNRGSATVETTLIMGIYILIIFMMIYIGFYLYDYTTASAMASKFTATDTSEKYSSDFMTLGKIADVVVKEDNKSKSIRFTFKYKFPIMGRKYKQIYIKRKKNNLNTIRRMKVLADGIK